MPPIEQISDEVRNRLSVWRSLIKEMHESLLVAEELWDMAIQENGYQIYSRPYVMEGKKCHYNFCFTARQAIFTQLLAHFGNIFGHLGKAGVGFSKNTDEQCELFKANMEEFVTRELQVSDIDYAALKEKLKKLRNEIGVHFDGDKAEYIVKDNGWVTTHKSPLVNFDQNEFLEVKPVIEAMYMYIERYFTAA